MFTGDWTSFKKEWEIRDSFPFSCDQIETSLSIIHRHFGPQFEKDPQRQGLGKSIILIELVELGMALEIVEKIGSPSKLLTKLKAHRDSLDFRVGLSEASFIRRILPTSYEIEYEPEIEGTKRNPDIVQKINSQLIQYEVHFAEQAAPETQRNKIIKELAERVGNNFKTGIFDIYLIKLDLSVEDIEKIVNASKEIIATGRDKEKELVGLTIVYYSPSGSLRLPEHRDDENLSENGVSGFVFDPQHDRAEFYKQKMGGRARYPGITLYGTGKDEKGDVRRKLIRTWRQSFDDRVWRKIIDETSQLSDKFPGIVVIEMGGTTALIDEWREIAGKELTSGVLETPSAVWLREKVWGLDIYQWNESLILNPTAMNPIDMKIIKLLFPPNRHKYTT